MSSTMFEPITLHGALLAPLREAMYYRLACGSSALSEALALAKPQRGLDAHAAYLELCGAGVLLDRLGWHEQLPSELVLEDPGQPRLAIEALTADLEEQAGNANLARQLGEDERAIEIEGRWQAVHAVLWRVEAAVADADGASRCAPWKPAGSSLDEEEGAGGA